MSKIFKGKLQWVPKWAQRYIAHLEEGYDMVEGLSYSLKETQITWRLLFGQLGDGEHYLPNKATIRFHLGNGKDIEFVLRGDTVRAYTYDGYPTVKTLASNALIISVDNSPVEDQQC